MNDFSPEQWDIILKIVGGLIALAGVAFRVWSGRQSTKLKVVESRAEEAKTEASNTSALIHVLNRQQGTLETILGRMMEADERQRESDARQRAQTDHFTEVTAANAASKTKLAEAVHDTNTRLSQMTTSLDANTNTLGENTRTVGAQVDRVGSVEQRLGSFETEIRRELNELVDAVRNGLSDERMKPLIEQVVQTTIDRIQTPPAEVSVTGSVSVVPPAESLALVTIEPPVDEDEGEEKAS